MRGSKNLIVLAVLGTLSCAVAGCSTANFDPTDMLDFLDTKKKLPGERKPVFPEGVPGLEQGVPKDLYRGSRQQVDQLWIGAIQVGLRRQRQQLGLQRRQLLLAARAIHLGDFLQPFQHAVHLVADRARIAVIEDQ